MLTLPFHQKIINETKKGATNSLRDTFVITEIIAENKFSSTFIFIFLSICEKFLNFFKNESKILTTSYSAHLTPF